jgi:hypothetical protein
MREAVRELAGAASKLGDEAERTRADLAGAFRKSSLDEVMLGELFARHDRALEELRKAFVGAAARIHETLDDEQRARLGDLLESGWHDRRRRGGHHPWHWHRSHHHHRDGAGAGHADARADLD